MARKLKIYQTSQGFFDLVIAAPSMKAALEAWGANSNLFHQGFAKEVDDPKAVKAALAKPGILLKRPVGSSEPFREQAHLPTSAQLSGPTPQAQKPPKQPKKAPSPLADDKAARKAALAYDKEHKRQQAQRQKHAAAEAKRREQRQKAIDEAEGRLDAAKRQHGDAMAQIDDERAQLDERARREEERWRRQREPLQKALRKATNG
jgi:colicin import membrane protein